MRPPPNAVPRTAPTTRGMLRVVRGSVVGLCAAGLGTTGHALAGGMLPDGRVLAAATGVLVVVTVSMSGRRWELPGLLTVLLGSQVALHVVLADSSHQHPGSAPEGLTVSGVMTAVHVVAALLTAVLLHRADEWCGHLVELLLGSVRTPRLAPLPVASSLEAMEASPEEHQDQWLVHWLSRRGPPGRSLV